ncbi:MAG: TIGR04283 family arsenosugar biosynthesis glycosyltransferase [Hyphomicrobiaceae bacterium]
MISVVIPTLNAASELTATLVALVPGVVCGVIREVIIVDGGSTDRTLDIAESSGARIIRAECGRGKQLAAGAEQARGEWLLFLHADTALGTGWEDEARIFMKRVETGERPQAAAAFRFALDDLGFLPRLIEFGVAWRCAVFRMPYGDQALLIPRPLYRQAGGYKPLPLMEDIDLNRRIGRRRIAILRTGALTSAVRYKRDGYANRVLRNWMCLMLYYCRVPTSRIAEIYF